MTRPFPARSLRSRIRRGGRPSHLAASILISALFLLAGPAPPAGASCAAPVELAQAIAESDVVVVGTVVATRSRGRIATVAVEENWKGDVATTFEVFGGPDKDTAASTIDRTYAIGTRYLLFANEPAAHGSHATFGGRYEDNSCTNTQPWTESLASLRPATAASRPIDPHSPSAAATQPAGQGDSSTRWLLGGFATIGTLVVATLVGARLRRRRSSAAA